MRQVNRFRIISVAGIMVVAVMVVAMALSPVTSQSAVIFSEDFEDTGVGDGEVGNDWDGPNGTVFSLDGTANLLNPGTGSSWLDPVPTELGEIFATIYSNVEATGDTGQTFESGLDYTLSFTHFRRDDVPGDPVRASIGDSGGALAFVDFDAVTATGSFLTRTVTYTATAQDHGQNIFLRFKELDGGTASEGQAGIDNIVLIPEPASLGLFGIVCAALWFARRKFRGIQS